MAVLRVNSTVGAAGSGASIAAAAISHTALNFIAVVVTWEGAGTLTSVTDTALNSYTPKTEFRRPGAVTTQIAYAYNITGNANNIVTANFTGTIGYSNIIAVQYSGITTTDPYDAENGGTGSGVTASTAALTTTQPGDLLFGGVGLFGTLTTIWTTPATEIVDSVGNTTSAGEEIGVAQGNYSGSVAISGPSDWAMAMVAFKAAGGPRKWFFGRIS